MQVINHEIECGITARNLAFPLEDQMGIQVLRPLTTLSNSSSLYRHISAEVVQDSLPALALVLGCVLGLRVKRLFHEDASIGVFDEVDLDLAAVLHPVF